MGGHAVAEGTWNAGGRAVEAVANLWLRSGGRRSIMGSLDWFCQARGAGAAAATQRLAGLRVRTCLEVHVQGNGAEVEERRGQGACRARYVGRSVGRSVGQIRSVLA
jgi:hypothetical protein